MSVRKVSYFFILLFFIFCFPSKSQSDSILYIKSWGWFGNPAIGFISLGDARGNDYDLYVNASDSVIGYGWIGTSEMATVSPLGWLQFDAIGPYPASPSHAVQYNRQTKKLTGWGRILSLANVCSDCGWVKFSGDGDSDGIEDYATYLDDLEDGDGEFYRLRGYAWSGDGSVSGTGLGFISFGPETFADDASEASILVKGDVYSGGNINSLGDAFIVLADGSITNLEASEAALGSTNAGLKMPSFDLSSYTINNIIGSSISTSLDGKVYKQTGDLNINSDIVFSNGGPGTIWVTGDLNINANIFYDSGGVSNLSNLGSLAWIVDGDVNINPAVRNLAGIFIVKNGVLSTGEGVNPLHINGILFAQQFSFGRKSTGITGRAEAAEAISSDGRTLANPPPGLSDLADIIPELNQVAP